jgi:hypothetical protein
MFTEDVYLPLYLPLWSMFIEGGHKSKNLYYYVEQCFIRNSLQ